MNCYFSICTCIGFVIQSDGLRTSQSQERTGEKPLVKCWFSSRANVGTTGWKYCFGCKVVPFLDVKSKELDRNTFLVVISRGDNHVRNLDTTSHSLVYRINDNKSVPRFYCLFYQSWNKLMASISFYKNGICFGRQIKFNAKVESQVKKSP